MHTHDAVKGSLVERIMRHSRSKGEDLMQNMRRSLNHERSIVYRSFERDDGLFEIEGHLQDTKGYDYIDRERGTMAPGTPLHDIVAVLAFDEEMNVCSFCYELRAVPFSYCLGSVDPAKLVGASIARGWRASLATAFAPHGGCTHLRELVFGMGTVAFQTVSALRDQKMFQAGRTDGDRTERPFFLGGCHSWAADSPVAQRYMPQFCEPGGSPEEDVTARGH